MNIRRKFLLLFLLMSIFPILILSLFTFNRYTFLINQQMSQVAENIVTSAVEKTNTTIGNIRHVSEIFTFDSSTKESIITDLHRYNDEQDTYTQYDVFQSNNNIKFICQNIIFTYDYINAIFVFTPRGEVLGYGYGNGVDVANNYNPIDDSWYQNTLHLEGKLYIDGVSSKEYLIGRREDSISFSRALYDVYTHEFLGVLLINCSPLMFDLSQVNTLPGSALLTVEQNNTFLYSNVNELSKQFNSKNSLRYHRDLDLEGLTLTAVFNYNDLYAAFGTTAKILVFLALGCAAAFAVIAIALSQSLTKPIVYLSQKMSARDGTNRLSDELALDRTDEIGVLYNEYQRYTAELDYYIKTELENKLITLDSQMKSLEAQINSHFLYNTLESINSIAEIEEVESIATMSLALGSMFRYSIKTQSELVEIADEIKHMQDYISIQKIRFDNRFTWDLRIPPEMYHLRVLKLILQPIVENTLYHGLVRCSIIGTITVTGHVTNHTIYISVSDNGIGMSDEKLLEIRTMLSEKAAFTELGQRNKQSIGIKNIHSRIELYYGVGYGLSVESKEGAGTTITIKLPCR